jgi:hypothetical protein
MYPYIEICYTYIVNGEGFDGRYKRGFWFNDSAEDLARGFKRLKSLTIRVCPDRPASSYVFEEDQSWHENSTAVRD